MTMIIAHTKTEHFLAFNVYVPLVLLRITLKGRYYYYSHIAYEATGAQGGQVTCLRSSSGEGVKSEMDPRLSGSSVLAFDRFSMLPGNCNYSKSQYLLSANSGPGAVPEFLPL